MALYRYTNNTKQLGVDHTNHVVALKVNPAGSPVFTVLAESQAAGNGTFILEWGADADPVTENWAGRVVIAAVDDDGAVELDVVAHDWLTGTLISVEANDYVSLVTNIGALHLWEMDEASGTWLDSIGSVDAPVTGTPTYLEAVPDQESNGALANSAYSRPATALNITSGVVTVVQMLKFGGTVDGVIWGLGDDVTNRIFLWYDNTNDKFGMGAGGGTSVYGIGGANALLGDDKWHCVISQVTVNDYAASKMWIDGVPQTMATQVGSPVNRNWNGKFGICVSAYTAAATKWPEFIHRLTYILGSITDEEAVQITMGAMTGYMDASLPVADILASFSFDARDGGVAADVYDEATGRVATATDVTFNTGKIEKQAVFNGTSSQIAIADRMVPNDNFSVSFWLSKTINTTSPRESIFSAGTDGDTEPSNANRLSLLPTTNEFEYFTETGAGDNHSYNLSHNAIADGSRNFYVLTVNAGTLELYENDTLVSGPTAIAPSTGTDPQFYIGRSMTIGSEAWLDASIDQFRITNALNATQRTALYNESRGPVAPASNYDLYIKNIGAVHYYKLDETTGTSIGDSSGSIDGAALVGVTTGAQIAGGLPETSIDFDGSTQAINLATQVFSKAEVNSPNDWAIITWLLPDAVNVLQKIIENGSSGETAATLELLASPAYQLGKSPPGVALATAYTPQTALTLVGYSESGSTRNFFINGNLDIGDSGRVSFTGAEPNEAVIGADKLSQGGGGQVNKYNGLMSSMSIHKSKIDLRMAERIWAVGRIGKLVDWGEGDSATLQDSMTLTVDNTVFTKNTASAVFSRGWSDIYINNEESFYAEVVFTTLTSNLDMTIGVSNSNTKTAFDVAGAYMYRTNGFLYTSGDSGVDVSKPAVQGDRLGIAYKNGSMWFRLNGGAWFSGDPETDTSPSITGITGDLYFYVCANNGTNQPVVTAAFGKAVLTDAVPATIEEGYYFSGYDEYIPLIAQNAWLMNEASGSLIDHIGDQDVAFVGAPTYEQSSIDVRDKAIDFNDAYTTATVDVTSGVVSIFALIKFDSTANNQVVFGLGSAAGDSNSLYYRQTSNSFGFNTWNSDTFGISNATSGPADGSWHFIIAEFHTNDFASNLLWIDDVSQSLSQVAGTSLNHVLSSNFGIGWNGFSGSSQEFEGQMSRLGFVNRALTATERTTLYQLAIGNAI